MDNNLTVKTHNKILKTPGERVKSKIQIPLKGIKYNHNQKQISHQLNMRRQKPNQKQNTDLPIDQNRFNKLVQICNRIQTKSPSTFKTENKMKSSYKNNQKDKQIILKTLVDFLQCKEQIPVCSKIKNNFYRSSKQSSLPIKLPNHLLMGQYLHKNIQKLTKSTRSLHCQLNLPQIIQKYQEQLVMTDDIDKDNSNAKSNTLSKSSKSFTGVSLKKNRFKQNCNELADLLTTNRTSSKRIQYQQDYNEFLNQQISPFNSYELFSKQIETQKCYKKDISIQKLKEKKITRIDVRKLMTGKRKVKSSQTNYQNSGNIFQKRKQALQNEKKKQSKRYNFLASILQNKGLTLKQRNQ